MNFMHPNVGVLVRSSFLQNNCLKNHLESSGKLIFLNPWYRPVHRGTNTYKDVPIKGCLFWILREFYSWQSFRKAMEPPSTGLDEKWTFLNNEEFCLVENLYKKTSDYLTKNIGKLPTPTFFIANLRIFFVGSHF